MSWFYLSAIQLFLVSFQFDKQEQGFVGPDSMVGASGDVLDVPMAALLI